MLNYIMVCNGYCKFNKRVTYTYNASLNNGSVLYFETIASDFKSIQDLKHDQLVNFYISKNDFERSDPCKDLLVFKTIAQLNKVQNND